MPFIEKGKPVFIDKPIVGSVADCKKLEELAEKGAVILGSSSVRYAEEIQNFLALPPEERGEILSINGTAGVDEFNYPIHIVEAIHELAQSEPVSTNFAGRAEREGLVSETFTVRFANGITGTYTTCHGQWHQFEVVIMTTKSTYYFQIDCGKIYGALLDRICDYMETGENRLAPVKKINQAIKIMLAGRLSRENGGGAFKIEDIPENDPGFDGDEFERDYAKAAAKIYLQG
jgi:predicted dehydrogenase